MTPEQILAQIGSINAEIKQAQLVNAAVNTKKLAQWLEWAENMSAVMGAEDSVTQFGPEATGNAWVQVNALRIDLMKMLGYM